MYNYMIPKRIIQVYKSEHLPVLFKISQKYILHNCRDFEYIFYTQESMDFFVKLNYPHYLELYNKLTIKNKISLFTLLEIYTNGGVYIDMDLLISKSLAGKSINNQIKSQNKNNLEKFKKIESDIKNEDEDISNKKNILSEDEYKKLVSQLNKKIKNYRVMVSENVDKNNKLKISATKKLIKKLNPILSDYSEKNSISIILQKRDIIIGKNSLNITDDIIKILDENVKEIKIN